MEKNLPYFIISGLILLLIYLNLFHQSPANTPDEYTSWGNLNIILHTVPLIIYFGKSNKQNAFPFIAIIALFQIIVFGLPVFFIRLDSYQMNKVLNLEALQISFYGFLIFYLTYFGLYDHVFKRLRPFKSIPSNLDYTSINVTRYIFLTIYLITTIYDVQGISHLGSFSLYVFLGFTLFKLLKARTNMWEVIIFLGVFLFEVVDRITSGLIAELAVLVLYLCLLILIEGSKKYLIIFFLVPFVTFYLQFSEVKAKFRSISWFGGKQLSYVERVDLIKDLIEEDRQVREKDLEGNDNLLWRFSYPMSGLSMVLTKTPSTVPYWDGESYFPLFTKFIPRVIWPTKPTENMGQRFGKTYQVIRQTDVGTSINTPILAELYMNFGYTGFYIGMCLLGFLFIFMNKFLNYRTLSDENKIVNMAILFPLMIMESNFSLVYGNVFLICISLYLIFRMVK